MNEPRKKVNIPREFQPSLRYSKSAPGGQLAGLTGGGTGFSSSSSKKRTRSARKRWNSRRPVTSTRQAAPWWTSKKYFSTDTGQGFYEEAETEEYLGEEEADNDLEGVYRKLQLLEEQLVLYEEKDEMRQPDFSDSLSNDIPRSTAATFSSSVMEENRQELRELQEPPPSQAKQTNMEIDNFVYAFKKELRKKDATTAIQSWVRMVKCKTKFRRWKQRRVQFTGIGFIGWKLMYKVNKLNRLAKERNAFRRWVEDTKESRKIKSALDRLTDKKLQTMASSVMVNLALSGNGFELRNQQRGKVNWETERMLSAVILKLKKRYWHKWKKGTRMRVVRNNFARECFTRSVIVQMNSRNESALVQNTLAFARNSMWPGEKMALTLKIWHRITKFNKALRNKEHIPDFPPLQQWDEWIALHEARNVQAHNADLLAERSTLNRYMLKWKFIISAKKERAAKVLFANRFFIEGLLSRCMEKWCQLSKTRGKNLRTMQKVLYAWHRLARREAGYNLNARMIRDRRNRITRRQALTSWVNALGMRKIVQLRADENLLSNNDNVVLASEVIYRWKKTQSVYWLHCIWRRWKKYTARKILWNKVLFVYLRWERRRLFQKYFQHWQTRGQKSEHRQEFNLKNVLVRLSDCTTVVESQRDEDAILYLSSGELSVCKEKLFESPFPDLQNLYLQRTKLLLEVEDDESKNNETENENNGAQTAESNQANTYREEIHLAADIADVDALRSAVEEKGLYVNECDPSTNATPLHNAASHLSDDYFSAVTFLLQHGAPSDYKNSAGRIPMELCVNVGIKRLLKKHLHRIKSRTFTRRERQWYRSLRISQWGWLGFNSFWKSFALEGSRALPKSKPSVASKTRYDEMKLSWWKKKFEDAQSHFQGKDVQMLRNDLNSKSEEMFEIRRLRDHRDQTILRNNFINSSLETFQKVHHTRMKKDYRKTLRVPKSNVLMIMESRKEQRQGHKKKKKRSKKSKKTSKTGGEANDSNSILAPPPIVDIDVCVAATLAESTTGRIRNSALVKRLRLTYCHPDDALQHVEQDLLQREHDMLTDRLQEIHMKVHAKKQRVETLREDLLKSNEIYQDVVKELNSFIEESTYQALLRTIDDLESR
eukprot:g3970.t1